MIQKYLEFLRQKFERLENKHLQGDWKDLNNTSRAPDYPTYKLKFALTSTIFVVLPLLIPFAIAVSLPISDNAKVWLVMALLILLFIFINKGITRELRKRKK